MRERPSSALDSLASDPATLSREALVEHAGALWALLRVADVVHRARDLDELMEGAVEAIAKYSRYPSVGLFRLDRGEGVLHLVAARGFNEEVVARARKLPVVGSLTGIAVTEGRVVTTADLRNDERLEPATRRALAEDGFQEAASVPLFHREEVIGALNLIYRHRAQLTDNELQVLTALGQTIGLAMSECLAEQSRAEQEKVARRTQQVESLGIFAGGIAHDFNNILTGVIGNLSLARSLSSAEHAELGPLLADAEQACHRSVGLARQLLTFARGGAPLKRPTHDLSTLVEEAARFAVHGTSIALVFESEAELGTIEVDPGQIMQVVHNLVLNAVQASPAGATVTVSLSRVAAAAVGGGPGPGRLRLIVADQGRGIAPGDLPHIFEPYFTTRAAGSGLGLATTRSIVERHDGQIRVESTPGEGCRFIVELALMQTEGKEPERPAVQSSPSVAGRRVLVMDDDDAVRTLQSRMLRSLGAIPEVARNGEEAIEKFAEAERLGHPFDLVVLDLTVVGGLGGKETVLRLHQLSPHVCALASSGYSDDPILSRPADYGFRGILPKPYSRQTLLAALAAALTSAPL